MGVAIVTGVFALVLALLSWLLTNGSRRGRLLSRIERQTAILKDLPQGNAIARESIERALLVDAQALSTLAAPESALKHGEPDEKQPETSGTTTEYERGLRFARRAQRVAEISLPYVLGVCASVLAASTAWFVSTR